MKAYAVLKNLNSESCKPTIVRNLKRILDIRIIDFDVGRGVLHFFYTGQNTVEKVKKELSRIGYPIQQWNEEPVQNPVSRITNGPSVFFFIGKGHKPFFFTGQQREKLKKELQYEMRFY